MEEVSDPEKMSPRLDEDSEFFLRGFFVAEMSNRRFDRFCSSTFRSTDWSTVFRLECHSLDDGTEYRSDMCHF